MTESADAHGSLTPEQEIASDQLDHLREHPDRCAWLSVHVGRHPWVRWNGETYEIAEMGHSKLDVQTCTKGDLLNLFAENPVDIKPVSEATYSPPEPGRANVWDRVEERADDVIYTENA